MKTDSGGGGEVYGVGSVYAVRHSAPPETCQPNTALSWSALQVYELEKGDTLSLPGWLTNVEGTALTIKDGKMDPELPY